MTNKDPKEALNSYITDMLSLERHIANALKGQLEDLKDYPLIIRELTTISTTVESHLKALERLVEERGGEGGASVIKKAGSAILGLGAAAIDLIRNESLPKNLRDDYTAFSLASIGYVMLHTTALALNDRRTADLAHSHLIDCAAVVMTLHNVIPAAVIEFLQEEGLPATEEVLAEVSRNVESAWRSQSARVPAIDQVSVRKH